jgi:uncharacterized protein
MNARVVWCVSDGRAGIERQTLAIAHALSELMPIDIKVVRLTPRGPQVWLPPQFWPAPLAALPTSQRERLTPASPDEWPALWIGNGRRSLPYSLRVKHWSGGKTLVVQVQDPKLPQELLRSRFDLVVPPAHDGLQGPNVHETLGAPVWYTKEAITAARANIAEDKAGLQVLVILGGTSKRHRFTRERCEAICRDLAKMQDGGAHLLITTSRRTPQDVSLYVRAFARQTGAQFFENEAQDGANPYLGWLASADAALVTEDSTNMITDAAFFGLPINLLALEGGDAKFTRLHDAFIRKGAARWWNGSLQTWTYPPVRDAMDVARAIERKLTSAAV